jgi:hypothetical protein
MKEANFSTRREYWAALVAEQKTSGLSVPEFCRSRGIARQSFYSWVGRLKRRPRSPELIRVERPQTAEPCRITFKNGATLHFGVRPEPEWLRLLLELVS